MLTYNQFRTKFNGSSLSTGQKSQLWTMYKEKK